ncbi:MAG: hypothetical protein KJ838_02120, partial [Candidatus Omnitrophica bacterium]|nr:hypothetical protein [Candidatus Omnitrophota bacterium]
MNSIKNLRLGKNWKSKILSLEFLSFLLVFYILISGFFISEASASETPQAYSFLDASKTISMDFKDVSLKDILKAFSIQAGVNFIASQEI